MLFVGLIHYPVVNARGEVIASAVANLDIHDIARTCRTYGVERFFVATPLEDQRRLVEEIRSHWVTGAGGRRNPHRREALTRLELVADLAGAAERAAALAGRSPLLYATSAKGGDHLVSWEEARRQVRESIPMMLLFGTADGLAQEVMEAVHGLLPPIRPHSGYRHLPVRAAVAIVLDRILGDTL